MAQGVGETGLTLAVSWLKPTKVRPWGTDLRPLSKKKALLSAVP